MAASTQSTQTTSSSIEQPYARDRVCYDADSHLMPEHDFLQKHADAKYRDRLRISGGANGGANFAEFFDKTVREARERMADPERTRKLEEHVTASAKGWAAHGAIDGAERSRTLDLLGFKRQLVFSTFAGQFLRRSDRELMYAATRAHARAMVDFCSSDSRLMPVTLIPLDHPEDAISELKAALELGCRAIQVPSDAPRGDVKGFSPSHRDLEPFWAMLAEAGVPLVLHIGGGHLLPPAYHKNGDPRVTDWLGGGENLRGKDFPALHHSPSNFLSAMLLDGIFDQFPALRCGVIELGASWVPGLLHNLDAAFRSFRKTEPRLQKLSMLPSDFVRRQIRFTPFPFEDIGWMVEQAGSELFLFSTDYPHPEGGRNPIKRFENSFDAACTCQSDREKFYAENFRGLFGL
jgi:predicted TIM-barrel fold metal-dependent hydrolase